MEDKQSLIMLQKFEELLKKWGEHIHPVQKCNFNFNKDMRMITNTIKAIENKIESDKSYLSNLDIENHLGDIQTGKWEHLKTGNIYNLVNIVRNATNANDNQMMVLYQREGMMFVREAKEFLVRFIKRNDR